MKTVERYIVAVMFLFATTIGLANASNITLDKKGNAKSEVELKLVNVKVEPVFVKKGGKLMMNLLNLSQEKVTVKVYDSQKRLVYNETIDGKVVVEKAFNFEKAFEDKYTVVVVDKLGTYTETMVVK
ncbi:hypothetical protein [Flagellimonas olearia]|uniref:DUF3244 domain-containing protein n=1 Tax=Flagellimonas olearia TaxID=552546 RepID=A0A444VH91_9FLAO|nr:hypothetical protein [Allomuricauda olearia]RYC50130.1 hypothetical protein DN53_06520 [Allomuricauda olearia]